MRPSDPPAAQGSEGPEQPIGGQPVPLNRPGISTPPPPPPRACTRAPPRATVMPAGAAADGRGGGGGRPGPREAVVPFWEASPHGGESGRCDVQGIGAFGSPCMKGQSKLLCVKLSGECDFTTANEFISSDTRTDETMSTAMENPHEMKTTWLIYLCCQGVGIGAFGSPCMKGQSKLLCVKLSGECDFTTDIMGDGGLCLGTGKCCCLVQAMQFIPSKFFIEFCGMRVVGGPKPGAGFGNATAAVEMTDSAELAAINEELAAAVKAEDFTRAADLKRDRDEFQVRIAATSNEAQLPVDKLHM
eukprot:CAMPEP_0173469556 /NCGR_PEP_ID=MMETSP1357-20121228/77420_1 /TAXON_ID=77926 /ORGANISM="Hemiselmis rufescens, Strain PCC563" /LENGTH=301 /DNA_ID=CAMNT_0014437801 /DNA_START=57 /DNA_END=964 /DNA_ORIENTATION=+